MVRLKNAPAPEDPVSILAIQNEGVSIDHYLEQSRKPGENPDLILWPEDAIGFVIRNMTADGAEFFAVPSMDPADWSERQHWQHAELFRHRAAENSRWMAVASSSGITQIIAPDGKRVSALPAMEPGELRGKLARSDGKTVFTRIGWLFGPGCFGLALLLVLARGVVAMCCVAK